MKRIQIEISWNFFWQVLIFLGIVLVFYLARQALGVLFTAIVISLALDPAVSFFGRMGVNRILGTLFVFIIGLIVVAAAIYFLVPIFVTEVGAFLTQFNEIFSNIFGFGVPEKAIESISENLSNVLSFITSTNISITGAISTVISNIIMVLATVIITFYLSIEKHGTERLLRVLLPNAYESSVLKVFNQFKNKIRLWLLAQLGLSLLVGAVVTLGLWLLGVEYAITLGVVAAIMELVPVIGPILSGIAAFLIAISESLTLGIYVIIFFFIVQQLENNVLIPLLMRKTMRIHPVMVIVSLIAGAQIAGFVGIILAVPIALLVQEILNSLAERKDHRAKSGLGI